MRQRKLAYHRIGKRLGSGVNSRSMSVCARLNATQGAQ